MKIPKIIKFRRIGLASHYTLDASSGKYTTAGTNEKFHILDFITNGITILEAGLDDSSQVVVKDRMYPNVGMVNKITSVNGHISIYTDRAYNSVEFLAAIRPRPEPIATPRPEPVAAAKKAKVDYEKLTNLILARYPDKIRMQGILKKRTETLEEFMLLFFRKVNVEKETIFAVSREVQTRPNKRRSLGDVFMIMQYYYPNCTLQEVVRILKDVLPNKLKGFRTASCGQINKRTYYFDPEKSSAVMNKDYVDEYKYRYDDY